MAHILIVDDDDIVAELASGILLAAGHACGFVSDAAEAWDLLQRRRPDLILLDVDMPQESGISLLRRLRASPQLYDLPVVMFTAQSDPGDEQRAFYHGAQGYVRKPLHPRLLLWRVDQVLRTRADRPKHRELGEWAEFQLRTHADAPLRKVYL